MRIWLLILFVPFAFNCSLSNNKIKKETEKLSTRYNSNFQSFDSLRMLSKKYAMNHAKTSRVSVEELINEDFVSYSLTNRISSLNIDYIDIIYREFPSGFDLSIYFKDMVDPNLFMRWVENFDPEDTGRNPLRKILSHDEKTKNAWIIQQEYP